MVDQVDIYTLLEKARSLLKELGNSISNLANSSPDVFEDPGIKSSLEGFLSVYQEAVQRLENPSFRIATIGTTSSGKSTIVNALIGRRIAPIEAGEMSGGVLTLKHSQEKKLIIEATENAAWDTGEWTGLSDKEYYQRISSTMHSYHEARKKREYVAPQITVFVPLLPACDPSLLGLHQGVAVELIDLPGLKSVQDQTNLAIIQKQVNKAFSLVALDYGQVDDKQRERLLEELKRVVEYLQGSTDSMIFILNRVDLRGKDDLPLQERINKLREEIQQVLSLPQIPDVIPFNARLLYYSQCAWGSGGFNKKSNVDHQTRLEFLKAMFDDCIGVIRLNTKEDKDLKRWFRDLEDKIEEDESIDDETMWQVLRYSLEWSGGQELWECFRKRVQESFAQIVILPALMEVFDNYQALSNEIDILIRVRKILLEEEVIREKNNVEQIRQNLKEFSKNKTKEFEKDIRRWTEGLKSCNQDTGIEIRKDAEKKGLKLEAIFEAVSSIEKDLISCLISPIIGAFDNNHSAYDLEEKLCEVIAPLLAKHIAKVYDNLSRRLGKFEIKFEDKPGFMAQLALWIGLWKATEPEEPEFLVRRVKVRNDDNKENVKELKELEHDERYVRLMYSTVREAMEARGNFLLQAKGAQFISALNDFINQCFSHQSLTQVNINLSTLNIMEAVRSNFIKKLPQSSPNLPEKFFKITLNIGTGSDIESEKTGEKDGSCGGKTAIYSDVEYKYLLIPTIDSMAKQWASGIENAKSNLWDIICDWSIEQLNQFSDLFTESLNEISDLAERALNEQLDIIQEKQTLDQERWQNFQIEKDASTEIYMNLELICRGNDHE